MLKTKKGIELQMLFWYIVGVLILVIVLFFYFQTSKQGGGALDYIKNLFKLIVFFN